LKGVGSIIVDSRKKTAQEYRHAGIQGKEQFGEAAERQEGREEVEGARKRAERGAAEAGVLARGSEAPGPAMRAIAPEP